LPTKQNAKKVKNQTNANSHKNAPTPITTQKERDAIIPAKDLSPDDLEILD